MSVATLSSLSEAEAPQPHARVWRSREFWGRAVPAGFFVGLVVIRRQLFADAASRLVSAPTFAEAAQAGLMLLFICLSAVFYIFISAAYLRRCAPCAASQGVWPSMLAMAGTWSAGPLALLPIVNGEPAWTIAASALTVFGVAASCLALFTLGKHFGIRPRARGVVSRGVYSRIRHPLYVFETIAQLGTLIVVLSPLALAIFATYVAFQVGRALTEERLLAQTFPAYRDYMARTSRFIPGVI